MKSITYRILAMLAVILVIGMSGLLARQFSSMDWIVENETRMLQFVKDQPWQAWFLGLAIYTLFSLVPGTAGKSVVCGWLFGFWQAVLLVDIGLTIAAIASFAAARFIARDTIKSRWGEFLKRLDRGLRKDAWFYLLQMRMAHIPFSFVNYGSGATSVHFRTFCWTTVLGLLPGTMIFVLVGTRIPTLAKLAEKGVWPMFDPILFALLASTIFLPLLMRFAIGRFRPRAVTEPEVDLLELERIATWPMTPFGKQPHVGK